MNQSSDAERSNEVTSQWVPPQGWEYVLDAFNVFDSAVDEIFALHDAALRYGQEEIRPMGDDHPGGYCCGCTEAPLYAAALMQMIGRHVEAVIRIGRAHPGYIYPARTLARAIVEHAGRVVWLLDPEDYLERESRWLAAKAESWRLEQEADPEYGPEPDWQAISQENFGHDFPKRIPGFKELMEGFDLPPEIVQMGYRILSQAVHGTLLGTYTLNQGIRKVLPEAENVPEPLAAAFWKDTIDLIGLAIENARSVFRRTLAPDYELQQGHVGESVFELMRRVPEPQPNSQSTPVKQPDLLIPPRPNRRARRAAAAERRRKKR